MVKITLIIEGMVCGMCEAHINDTIRNVFKVKKVTSSRAKKKTVIISPNELPNEELKSTIKNAGYDVISIRSEPYGNL